MDQTLFHLPPALFDGWLLGIWLVGGALLLGWNYTQHRFEKETINTAIVVAFGSLLIWKVFPLLEDTMADPANPDGPEISQGLAIRGYGLMFLLGAVGGVGISLYRASQVGLNVDRIIGLAGCMIVSGIIGARLFYVIQYRDQFFDDGVLQLGSVLNMTEGGLVVYGSVIGGVIAGIIYLKFFKMPTLAIADVIAPGMVLGLALGRIGCLLNGCCYGGICDSPVAIQFPAGSAPYMRHYQDGDLIGVDGRPLETDPDWLIVDDVAADSIADDANLQKGDRVRLGPIDSEFMRQAHENEQFDRTVQLDVENDIPYRFTLSELPARSNPVHPTQIYSALNAAILCAFLWFLYPYRRNDGEIFGVLLILYAMARFVLEGVRSDEPGRFGTELTVSQFVSIATFVAGICLITYVRWAKTGRHFDELASNVQKT